MSRQVWFDRGAAAVTVITLSLVNVMMTIRATIPPTWSDLPAELAAHVFFCLGGYLLYPSVVLGSRFGLAGRIAFCLVGVCAVTLVSTPLIIGIFNGFSTYPHRSWGEIFGPQLLYVFAMPYMFNGAALIAYSLHRDVMLRERQLAEARHMAQDAQLLALRYQINPHFLFNTLNAASTLVLERRNQAAEVMLLQLAGFFRLTLTLDSRRTISLVRELELQRTYLAIEKVRFGDDLEVEIDLQPGLETAQVPALLLQPLVENAVKHALGGEGGSISIRASSGGAVLSLAVSNTVHRPALAGTGTGLRNVTERLMAEYGEAAALNIESRDDRYRIVLTLPLTLEESGAKAPRSPA